MKSHSVIKRFATLGSLCCFFCMPGTNADAGGGSSQSLQCNLSDKDQQKYAEEYKGKVFEKADKIVELEEGLEYVFNEDEAFNETLIRYINLERKCCPFFSFSLHFEPEEGPVRLKIYGSAEMREFQKEHLEQMGLGDKIQK